MQNCHLTAEDYAEVKQAVMMRQLLEHYGYTVNSRGWAICPLHKDRKPSMRVYPDGFYCFACGAGGDVITFVARTEGLSNEAAAKQIIRDFGIPINLEQASYREQRERQLRYRQQQELRAWAVDANMWLSMYRQLLCESLRDPGGPHFDEALQELSIVDYRLACLRDCPEQYYADRKAVKRIGEIRDRVIGWGGGATA